MTGTPDAGLAPTLADLGPRPREALDRLGEAGFRAVQLSASQPGLRPRDLDRSGRRDLLGRLRRLELTAAGIDLWIPGSHLSDPAQIDRAVTAIMEAIALASDLGRCPLSLTLPPADDAVPPAFVEAVTEQALRHGVPVADHQVPPADRQDIGVGIDPALWLGRGRDPAEAVTAHAQRLATARLRELESLDLPGYRAALESCGYQGHVIIDLRGEGDPWAHLPAAAHAWSAAEGAGGLAI